MGNPPRSSVAERFVVSSPQLDNDAILTAIG
jgi:hypothetical protein